MTDSEFRNYAKQSGLGQLLDCDGVDGCLEHFANLVAQHEREECAKVCDDLDKMRGYSYADKCATAIRARKKA